MHRFRRTALTPGREGSGTEVLRPSTISGKLLFMPPLCLRREGRLRAACSPLLASRPAPARPSGGELRTGAYALACDPLGSRQGPVGLCVAYGPLCLRREGRLRAACSPLLASRPGPARPSGGELRTRASGTWPVRSRCADGEVEKLVSIFGRKTSVPGPSLPGVTFRRLTYYTTQHDPVTYCTTHYTTHYYIALYNSTQCYTVLYSM